MRLARRPSGLAIAPTLLLVVTLSGSCGDGGEPQPSADAGVACAAGEAPLDGGGCLSPGAASACPQGFVPDGAGCVAVLPTEACPSGSIAVPGDARCRDVAPCARGTWGDIPVEPSTQFVDGSYAGADSDGSSSRPWTTIQEGVDASAANAIVAVAAGTYAESVIIEAKSVRVWGVCPGLVEVVTPPPPALAAFDIRAQADGTEVHDVAVRGLSGGIGVSGSTGVLVERAWIHETANHGVHLQDDLGASGITLRDSVVEAATQAGIFLGGACTASIEQSDVRGTRSTSTGLAGDGIIGTFVVSPERRPLIATRSSVIEHNRHSGVYVSGGDVTIESSVVRDTQPQASDQSGGRGVEIQAGTLAGQRSTFAIVGSAIERSYEVGVLVAGSDATIEATTVRDIASSARTQRDGIAIALQDDVTTGQTTTAAVASSTLNGAHVAGLWIRNAAVTIDSCTIDGVGPDPNGGFGDGIDVLYGPMGTSVALRWTRIQETARAGIANFGAIVTVEASAFGCNPIALDGENVGESAASFSDLGGNACGCSAATATCTVLSSNLDPPDPPSAD